MSALDEVKSAHNGYLPLIYQVMEQKNVLSMYWQSIKPIKSKDFIIKDPFVKEGIMLAFATQCSNEYCYNAHSSQLLDLHFGSHNVKNLFLTLSFPDSVKDSEKWSRVLKWAFMLQFSNFVIGANNIDHLRNIQLEISPEESIGLFQLITASQILTNFSEYYPTEVSLEKENYLRNSPNEVRFAIPNLATYYMESMEEDKVTKNEVLTICMHCKDIQDKDGQWLALETVLSAIRNNIKFSHSICQKCYEKYYSEL